MKPGMLTEFIQTSRIHPLLIWLMGLVSIALIALADYGTGEEISLAIFYIFPILLLTWGVGLTAGLLSAGLCSLLWARLDITIPYQHFYSPYWSLLIKFAYFAVLVVILQRLQSSLAKERKAATEDALTGLRNRRAFFELGHIELNRARRHKKSLALAYLDADDFKRVNDTLGHETGDRLLCEVARVFQQNLRITDLSARLGGDEFVILLTDCSPDRAEAVMTRVKSCLLEVMAARHWPVTFSIGLVIFADLPETVDEMICQADLMMYEVKHLQKNQLKSRVYHRSDGYAVQT